MSTLSSGAYYSITNVGALEALTPSSNFPGSYLTVGGSVSNAVNAFDVSLLAATASVNNPH